MEGKEWNSLLDGLACVSEILLISLFINWNSP